MRIGRMNSDDKEPPQYFEDSDDEDEDSTTGSSSPEYISYRSRPEWADIQPISIRTESSVMDIRYTPRYEDTFSYFRAMLMKDELSERALALTADCIELQQSNFTVWFFRRRILRKLQHLLPKELDFIERIIQEEPKNYQVWHHRKTIVEWLRDGSHDKKLTASIITIDNKNYHAWQHRQWVIKEFSLWDGELEFTEAQLAMDIKNNSAWNHRYFIIKETRLFEDHKWIRTELSHVHERIEQLPTNESSWSYLRGLLILCFRCICSDKETQDFCQRLYSEKNCQSPHLLSFLIDSIREKLSKRHDDRDELKKQARELCQIISQTDKVRCAYWAYIANEINEL